MFAGSADGFSCYIYPGAVTAFGWFCPDNEPRIVGLGAATVDGFATLGTTFGELTQMAFEGVGECASLSFLCTLQILSFECNSLSDVTYICYAATCAPACRCSEEAPSG